MEWKELVKHHTQVIKDQNQNKWEVIETSDLEEICEAYHQAKLKLLGIADVVGQSEQLKCGVLGGVCPYETGDRLCRAKFKCENQVAF